MSKVVIQGNNSGTGTFTVTAPNSNNSREITLPDSSGDLLALNSSGAISGTPITVDNGKVGVGTSTPTGNFHAKGGSVINSGWHNGITIEPSGNGNYPSLVFDKQLVTSPDQYGAILWTRDAYGADSEQLGGILIYNGAFDVFLNNSVGTGTSQSVLAIFPNGSVFSKIENGSNTLYPSYTAKAWVNFNGTGTVAIRGSGNVSSISDSDVGTYIVNFTTAMPDVNFVTNVSGDIAGSSTAFKTFSPDTGGVYVFSSNLSYSPTDADNINVSVHR